MQEFDKLISKQKEGQSLFLVMIRRFKVIIIEKCLQNQGLNCQKKILSVPIWNAINSY